MTQVGCETSSPPCPPPHVCCCPASVHATGMVVDSGAVPPTRCPIVRASPAPHQHLGLANSDLRDDLTEILTERGYGFTTTAGRELVLDVGGTQCYVTLDPEQETALLCPPPPSPRRAMSF